MSLEYIAQTYGVPARKDACVRYTGDGKPIDGIIKKADGSYLMIQFSGEKGMRGPFHPTWKLEYLDTTTPTPRDGGEESE